MMIGGLFILLLLAASASAADKPHILFLLVDDWGWANVGYHREVATREVQTPNFDSLVKNGLELDQNYVFYFCSPSRSSLMTGRLPIHVNDNNGVNGYTPDDPITGYSGIPPKMTGIAEKLKIAGYETHMVGKWHAGSVAFNQIPISKGFDSYFGYLHGANDYYNETSGACNNTPIVDLWENNQPAWGLNGTDYEEAMFTERVLEVLKNHDSTKPLFLYYAPHIVHAPLEVPDKYVNMFNFIDDHDRQYYHAMTTYLDDFVGKLVSALKEKGLWDNLLFVISSDNGGPIHPGGGANNYPLKGGKVTDWQGGIRVNGFVSGGYLPEKMRGQKTDGYIHIADWYSTFCNLAGVDPTDERAAEAKLPPIDSLNMWPMISGQNATSPRVDIPASYFTLISGEYKILTGDIPQAGWTGPQYPNVTTPSGIKTVEHCGDGGCLYNIKDDPEERENLATKMPDVLKEMQQKLAKYQATRFNPKHGPGQLLACQAANDKYKGFWGPFATS
jgi:arylsulfatase I/J